MSTALITGASSGIGLELAHIFAANNADLVLVARSGDKLQALADSLSAKHAVKVRVMIADLSKMEQVQQIYTNCKAENIQIDYLINNAGFGDFGFFQDSDWKKQEEMIDLNVKALTLMCRLFLTDMLSRGSGKLMNIASTAAFQPGPKMSVYFATKAYVLHFSEAIANELDGTGITITALCPGATESGFQVASALEASRLVKGKKLPSAASVAAYGYQAMMNGTTVAVPGIMNKMMTLGYRLFPRKWVVKVTRMVQE